MTGTVTGYSAEPLVFPKTTASAAFRERTAQRRWRFVSMLVALGMLSFLLGQNLLNLRDLGGMGFLPHIIIFPWFAIGACSIILAGFIAIFSRGERRKLSVSLGLVLLGLLTCWSLILGHYNSVVAVREALFSASGIGVWLAFLLFLPGQNKRFWVCFRRHLMLIYKLALVLQVLAIALALMGNKGLLRVNFSTSISLFIFVWGVMASDKSLTRWGLLGVLLFAFHSLFQNQRETFLLPLEFLALFLPVYLGRSFAGSRKRFSSRFIILFAIVYLHILAVPIVYFAMPSKLQGALSEKNISEDTRALVLKDYMASDMKQPISLLFGKGVNGYYKSRLRVNAIGGRGTSTGIEMGYLQMFVNVGAVFAVIMILMGLMPSVRGILISPTPLGVAAGLWVLVRLINMTIASVPRTEFNWFLFWLCIGVLHSKERISENAALTAEPAR
jgi:hypothetical protein